MTGSVSEILVAAADLLEKPGAWTQGALALGAEGEHVNVDSSSAVCFCVVGAIRRASGYERTPEKTIPVREALCALLGLANDGVALVAWNDNPKRTPAEVVAALRQAAAKARVGG